MGKSTISNGHVQVRKLLVITRGCLPPSFHHLINPLINPTFSQHVPIILNKSIPFCVWIPGGGARAQSSGFHQGRPFWNSVETTTWHSLGDLPTMFLFGIFITFDNWGYSITEQTWWFLTEAYWKFMMFWCWFMQHTKQKLIYPLVIQHSHGKWPIKIDGLPIKNGGSF